MNEKAKIANTLKIFKDQIASHSNKIKENTSNYEDFEDYEEVIKDDEDDLQYLENLSFNLTNSLIKYDMDHVPRENEFNTDYTPEKTGNASHSTFIKTPECLRLKSSVLNSNNNNNKCFQYSVTLSLYHEEIGNIFCRISTIKPFINNID